MLNRAIKLWLWGKVSDCKLLECLSYTTENSNDLLNETKEWWHCCFGLTCFITRAERVLFQKYATKERNNILLCLHFFFNLVESRGLLLLQELQ